MQLDVFISYQTSLRDFQRFVCPLFYQPNTVKSTHVLVSLRGVASDFLFLSKVNYKSIKQAAGTIIYNC